MFKSFKLGPTRLIAAGFAILIILGSLLLYLPAASRDGQSVPYINALFTATSATCVTGLTIYDSWTQFSFFGQVVILFLIQVGGLGFMTFAIVFSLALGRRIGLRERSLLAEAVGSGQLGGVVRLTRHILLGTLVVEAAGAVLLAIRLCPKLGFWRGAWFSVFHSVSAFCNAGFDLMGRFEPGSSLICFNNDPLVVLTISALIVIGGLGFIVWEDVIQHGIRFKHYKLHSRAVLIMTGALLLIGTLLFLFMERSASQAGMGFGQRLLNSFFASVTPRTAGFCAVVPASMSEGGTLLTMLLMIIGASPGSTGGGAKTTTILVMLLTAVAATRGREDVNTHRSRLEPDTVRRAFTNFVVYIGILLLGVLLILCVQELPVTDAMYEAISAMGTVGISRGITAQLNGLPKSIIMLLMYTGRVGSLTVFLAVSRSKNDTGMKKPVGRIIVG